MSQPPPINLHVNLQVDNTRNKTIISGEQIQQVSISASPGSNEASDIPEMEHGSLKGRPRDETGVGIMGEVRDRETVPDAMKIYRLGERSNDLMDGSKYLLALEQLQLLDYFQPNQLKTMLMIAECNLMLDRQETALKVIMEIKKVIATSDVKDIINESDICVTGRLYLRAVIFLFCAAKSCAKKEPQCEALPSVGECINKIDACLDFVTNEVKSLSPYMCKVMISIMNQIIVDLSKLDDCDARVRVLVRCVGNKADSYRSLEEYREALKMYNECLGMMQRQYGLHASKSRDYEEFLFNCGWCHSKSKEYEEAKVFYEKSLSAVYEAEDYEKEEREEIIKFTKNALRDLDEKKYGKSPFRRFFRRR